MRHVFVGMSQRVYCGVRLDRDSAGRLRRTEESPLTEGEWRDGVGHDDICPECDRKVGVVRGPRLG